MASTGTVTEGHCLRAPSSTLTTKPTLSILCTSAAATSRSTMVNRAHLAAIAFSFRCALNSKLVVCVRFHGLGQWWMFYFGGSAEKMELRAAAKRVQGFRMRPGLVKSDDGILFDRTLVRGINPLLDVGASGEWDELFVAWPRVLPPSGTNSSWLLTYSSIEKQTPPFSSIGFATSSDGHRWTKAGKVLTRGATGSWDEGGVGRRHVVLIEDEYVMFYEGVDRKGVHGIGLAVSSDGVRWKRDTNLPVFTARVGEEAWDNGTVAAPHVVQMDNGSFRLYYVGSNDSKSESAIGMAVSEGRNFRSWVRF